MREGELRVIPQYWRRGSWHRQRRKSFHARMFCASCAADWSPMQSHVVEWRPSFDMAAGHFDQDLPLRLARVERPVVVVFSSILSLCIFSFFLFFLSPPGMFRFEPILANARWRSMCRKASFNGEWVAVDVVVSCRETKKKQNNPCIRPYMPSLQMFRAGQRKGMRLRRCVKVK